MDYTVYTNELKTMIEKLDEDDSEIIIQLFLFFVLYKRFRLCYTFHRKKVII